MPLIFAVGQIVGPKVAAPAFAAAEAPADLRIYVRNSLRDERERLSSLGGAPLN
jgi:hypothetical protein